MSLPQIPTPVFLDSSVLQTVSDHGGFVFENVEPPAKARIRKVPGGMQELDALRLIFLANQRNSIPMVISDNSLKEVADRGHRGYLSWAFEILEWCESFEGARYTRTFLRPSLFGYLSAKDRILLEDSIYLGCRSFLTMERKLPRNRDHIRKFTGLEILRPTDFWTILEPWAPIFM